MVPPLNQTVDGWELQIAANVINQYAFTLTVLPMLRANLNPTRIVNVSSLAANDSKSVDRMWMIWMGRNRYVVCMCVWYYGST